MKTKLSHERLLELFDYHEDGYLIWKVKSNRKILIGSKAGHLNKIHGYMYIRIDSINYRLHRIIWFYHNGYMSENDIDHKDQNKLNNRIENLREISQSCNNININNRKDSKSGIKGVSYSNKDKVWVVQIKPFYKRNTRIGGFKDFDEAVAHRLAAEQCLNWEGCNSTSPSFLYINKGI